MTTAPSAARVARLRRQLLDWYAVARRELPWRRDADAYRVWISEVMLQQTRVEAVIPYYERWLERFPDLDALADAGDDDVLRAWQGLGYYTRARNLQRAALAVRERHGGRLPEDVGGLRALPGIGDYTAGAIASIAYGRVEPAVDGNARRVLCRLLDAEDPSAAVLRRIAARLVDPRQPGAFNQAMMELGSRICTPRRPACGACPVRSHCRARRAGTQALRPRPKEAAKIPSFDVGTAVLIRGDGRFLLVRRPAQGLLAGLWEFPGAVVAPGETALAAARRRAGELVGRPRVRRGPVHLASVDHVFSHRRENYHVYRFDVSGTRVRRRAIPGGSAPAPAARAETMWVAPDRLGEHALPAAQRRIARLVMDGAVPRAGETRRRPRA